MAHLVLSLPEAVRLARLGLPETDGTVLGARGVDFTVRRVRRAENGAVVALVNLALSSRVEVVDADPGVGGRARDEAVAEERVKRGRGDVVRKLDRHGRVLAKNVEEVDILASSHGQGAATVGELHRVDWLLQVDLANLRQSAKVPPADG